MGDGSNAKAREGRKDAKGGERTAGGAGRTPQGPGLDNREKPDATLVGVGGHWMSDPRVDARASHQPWASGHIPVGDEDIRGGISGCAARVIWGRGADGTDGTIGPMGGDC